MTSYSAILISFLTVVNDELEFKDLNQMVQLDKYKLGIIDGDRIEEYLKVIFSYSFSLVKCTVIAI